MKTKADKFDTGQTSIYWNPVPATIGKKIVDRTEDARRLKPEFDKLSYIEKLKFMDEHFPGVSGIEDDEGDIISTSPDPNNKEQVRIHNEYFIKMFEIIEREYAIEFFFDRLRQRFEDEILMIKAGNPHPEKLIEDYIQKQIENFSLRIQNEDIQRTIDFYKGDWDLSIKLIDTNFLRARAWINYIGFLQEMQNQIEVSSTLNMIKRNKPCESFTRARAFCIEEILKRPKFNEIRSSKRDIIKLVETEFPGQSGKTVYEERIRITNMKDAINRYRPDYEYGMELYRDKYPDS
ncbi:MAG TPA: hypothetical protein VMW76_09670 [Bacteroidales bacterium]|nr:hypothetical protein [Bacteroidales bacterium]